MTNIYGINGYRGAQPINSAMSKGAGPAKSAPAETNRADQVEISNVARFLSKISQMPDIRAEKVEEIRQVIAQGNYDTDEKLSAALDNFLNEYLQE
ncbi:MAG: flagellar biosynthesis anti-sigma factor FlgM [Sedimentisphaerales bacterium]|nr:flagellar biosynthesis anti-sigma factor FlgM [Sedimentisphaerales bacterium]